MTELHAQPCAPHPQAGARGLFGVVVVGLVVAWMAKVLHQLFRAADLNARLPHSQSLQLEGLSAYAPDLQMLIRRTSTRSCAFGGQCHPNQSAVGSCL
mmetsp:Transcript_39508/g.91742  ORF Transcript_39508/g.91742 Transcript_39508/m.91742 type:complete len:98 (+) Transcript_39508:81-374(+)